MNEGGCLQRVTGGLMGHLVRGSIPQSFIEVSWEVAGEIQKASGAARRRWGCLSVGTALFEVRDCENRLRDGKAGEVCFL